MDVKIVVRSLQQQQEIFSFLLQLYLIVDQKWSGLSQEGYSFILDIGRYEMTKSKDPLSITMQKFEYNYIEKDQLKKFGDKMLFLLKTIVNVRLGGLAFNRKKNESKKFNGCPILSQAIGQEKLKTVFVFALAHLEGPPPSLRWLQQ